MMLGSRLLLWMEAHLGRPKKKAHRSKKVESPKEIHKSPTNDSSLESGSMKKSTDTLAQNNLSSPESAYFTGDSTDGASPIAPPDYYEVTPKSVIFAKAAPSTPSPKIASAQYFSKERSTTLKAAAVTQQKTPKLAARNEEWAPSPRQRNRIRTNPWLATPKASEHEGLRERAKYPPLSNHRWLSPKPQSSFTTGYGCYLSSTSSSSSSSSSSSCNSLNDVLRCTAKRAPASDEEDDRTLNEMMGKYDESYIYEKETDILSDSDPTDCAEDTDDGRDAGDERDTLDDLDYIDNGSMADMRDPYRPNTGHCSYYPLNQDARRSRRKKLSHKKPSKENLTSVLLERKKLLHLEAEGSRSLGTTPVTSRRARLGHVGVTVLQSAAAFNQVDREADKKYKQLITEAEHILRTVAASPRRAPLALANKRIESIKNSELANNCDYARSRGEPVRSRPTFTRHAPGLLASEGDKANDCPQSEPVKRKVYSSSANAIRPGAIDAPAELINPQRRQILLHTIACLKQNLEIQSASLKQVYR